MKKYQSYLLSFIIPIGILLFIMLVSKIYPFGDKILLLHDGYNQYPGFLSAFINSISSKQSILYSFKGLLGFNLYACFAYYALNISNLLMFLFKNNIVNFYTFIIILKMGLASLTMNIFLSYIKKDKNSFIFSICYGLTSYNLLYYLNYMWFDSIILLPLVVLGIEKIFKDNNYYFYTIFLSLSIIFNFYIGFMICIFSVIYFIYKMIATKAKKNTIIKYLFYSLLSGLIASFVLIPVILELLQGKAGLISGYADTFFKFDLDFVNVFYKLSLGSYSNGDVQFDGPNVYVSIFVFINVILLFFNNRIKLKEKLLSGCILLFFILSMSFNLLDYFWHMMQMPIWYPVRYAFIFDFYLIYLAYKNYNSFQKPSKKTIFIIVSIMVVLMALGFLTSGELVEKENIFPKLVYLGISIVFIVYYFLFGNNIHLKKFIFIILIIELSLNTYLLFKNSGNINTYSEFMTNYNNNLDVIDRIKLNNFERLTFEDRTIKNNGLLLNYTDLNLFSSVRNQKTYDYLYKVMGVKVTANCNTNYFFSNPIANSFLNIKYYATKKDLEYYTKIDTVNGYNIYMNQDASNFGFITDDDINKFQISKEYYDNINNLVKIINESETNILSQIDPVEKNISCTDKMCITNGNYAYMNYYYKSNKDVFIFLQNNNEITNDESTYELKINGEDYSFDGKYPVLLKKASEFELTIKPAKEYKDNLYKLFAVNFDEYEDLVHNLKENSLEVTNYINDAHFYGKIEMENDGILYTNIANDNGWKVFVDNNEEDITPLLNGSIIGINLSKGEHNIEFKYFPPGLKIGLIISAVSISTFGLIIFIKKKDD